KSVYSLDGKIDLSIPLPVPLKISVIQLEGEVRWVSPSESKPGMGIQFKNISNKNLSALKDFVRREL
ncbi:MAG: PilZ domain-containing protein, partial [Proteobacteria bacterium]|nr:PilZ domain-containing protein [Pseudomonadota bacterium]